jgi:hypothetical protein
MNADEYKVCIDRMTPEQFRRFKHIQAYNAAQLSKVRARIFETIRDSALLKKPCQSAGKALVSVTNRMGSMLGA